MGGRALVRVLAVFGLAAVSIVGVVSRSGPSGAAPAGASAFVPVSPTRVLDTPTGLGATTLPDDGTIDVQGAGHGGVPATGAVPVALNLTATGATLPGVVTACPSDGGRPIVSNLNVEHAGQTIPNFAVVRLGSSGRVSFYALKRLDLIADVAGYWVETASATAGRYVA